MNWGASSISGRLIEDGVRIWRRIRELLNRVNREQGGVPRFRGKVLHRIVHYAKGFRESGPALSGDTSYNALDRKTSNGSLLPIFDSRRRFLQHAFSPTVFFLVPPPSTAASFLCCYSWPGWLSPLVIIPASIFLPEVATVRTYPTLQ